MTGNPGALPDLKEFAPALHCVHIAVDGLVYVCERGSDRIQVFTKQGKFVTSFFVYPPSPPGARNVAAACTASAETLTI